VGAVSYFSKSKRLLVNIDFKIRECYHKFMQITYLCTSSPEGLRPFELNKDFFWVPYYLGKKLEAKTKIVYYKPKQFEPLANTHLGVNFEYLVGKSYKKTICKYIRTNALLIDVLMVARYNKLSLKVANIYKRKNKRGYVYMKADSCIKANAHFPKKLLKRIVYGVAKSLLGKHLFRNVDLISFEGSYTFNAVNKQEQRYAGFSSKIFRGRIVHMPNGYADDIKKYPKTPSQEKENLLITVGRLGSYPKNTEMLLSALSIVDLKDWRVALIGPYTEEFKTLYKTTINKKPELKNRIMLIGNQNREELYNWYNRAKIFCLTSRYEGYAVVFGEAMPFKNYFISTDVGGAQDATNDFTLGAKITDESTLVESLQKVIDDKNFFTKELYNKLEKHADKFYWGDLIEVVATRIKNHTP